MSLAPRVVVVFMKLMVSLFMISVISSGMALYPFYMTVSDMGNEIVMKTSVNNFIHQGDINEIVNRHFSEGPMFMSLVKNDDDNIHEAINISVVGTRSSGDTVTMVLPGNRGNFAPGFNNDDRFFLYENVRINRSESINVAVGAEYRFNIIFMGVLIPLDIPLEYRKGAIAMKEYGFDVF